MIIKTKIVFDAFVKGKLCITLKDTVIIGTVFEKDIISLLSKFLMYRNVPASILASG